MIVIMRKPAFAFTKEKHRSAERYPNSDQHLCLRYIDSTIPLLSKSDIAIPLLLISEISHFLWLNSLVCQT